MQESRKSLSKALRPFFSLWIKPKTTVQYIIEYGYPSYVPLLILLTSNISTLLVFTIAHSMPINLAYLMRGMAFGIVFFFINILLLRMSGAWVGGKATVERLIIARAWVSMLAVLWIVPIFCISFIHGTNLEVMPAYPRLFLGGYLVIIGIWYLVVEIMAIQQVQGFSGWKTLFTYIIAAALTIVIAVFMVVNLRLLGLELAPVQTISPKSYRMGERNDPATIERQKIEWYKKAAAEAVTIAQVNLGRVYYFGFGGYTKSVEEALKWWRKAAEKEDANAQYNIATLYYDGDAVDKDHAEAVKWYLKAAMQGHAFAQYNLGYLYHKGDGVPRNDAESVKWYRTAAAQGNVPALTNLGMMYCLGSGVQQNNDEARKWYSLAAKNGGELAEYTTGLRLTPDVRQYDVRGIIFFAGNPFPNVKNAAAAYSGIAEIPRNDLRALEWYFDAAQKGNVSAQASLGYMYAYELMGRKKDYISAYYWFSKAMDSGNKEVITERDKIAHAMSPEQIAKAKNLYR